MAREKRILFLGGSHFQIPPIKYARNQGHRVITCDYLPENPGHRYADEYHNVSTTDVDGILRLAQARKVDGIVAYASDPAAFTQAYVANQLGLPSNPLESVRILARKDLFREFLARHQFHTPRSSSFYELEEAAAWLRQLAKPVMVKPVDASGSKGVSKIHDESELATSFELARSFSREKKVVIEEFVARDGYQIAGDGFVVDGQLVFRCWANEHFNDRCNPLVPIGESFPAILAEEGLELAHAESQRLLTLLGMKGGALNFDFHYDRGGNFSFIELGPRNGGNLIPEVIRYCTGIDLAKYTVDWALGFDCSDLKQVATQGYYSSYMMHATQDGVFGSLWRSKEILENILEETIFVKPGEKVSRFDGSQNTLGALILKFESQDEMLEKMNNMDAHFQVRLK